jgi:hypothetical protein
MTEELILKWLNMVWKRRQGALLRKCTMLVLDSFHGHMTERVKAKVEDSDLVVIPSGMTKLLQLLDVSINQPFKITFWWLYNQWMTTTKHELRPRGGMKRTPLPTVCEWILAAWCSISPETAKKSFKVSEISNEIDRSENYMINDTDNESESNDNGDDSSIGNDSE